MITAIAISLFTLALLLMLLDMQKDIKEIREIKERIRKLESPADKEVQGWQTISSVKPGIHLQQSGDGSRVRIVKTAVGQALPVPVTRPLEPRITIKKKSQRKKRGTK